MSCASVVPSAYASADGLGSLSARTSGATKPGVPNTILPGLAAPGSPVDAIWVAA
jgi:hypothetical protein